MKSVWFWPIILVGVVLVGVLLIGVVIGIALVLV